MLRLSLNTIWQRSACLQLLSPNLEGSLRFLMHWGNIVIHRGKCHVFAGESPMRPDLPYLQTGISGVFFRFRISKVCKI